MIGQRLGFERVATGVSRVGPVQAEAGMVGIPLEVMADVEIQVAVVVQVGEGRRGRPVAIAPQPGRGRHILERAVPAVMVKGIRPPAGDEEVGAAIVIVVAHGHAVAIPLGRAGQARGLGDVLEAAVPAIPKEAVAPRGAGIPLVSFRGRRSGGQAAGTVRPAGHTHRASRRRRSRSGRPRRLRLPAFDGSVDSPLSKTWLSRARAESSSNGWDRPKRPGPPRAAGRGP